MSEHSPDIDEPTEEQPVHTGNPAVDEVLDSLDGLDEATVDEHVAIYEKAHEKLRGALDAQPAGGGNPVPSALRPGS